MKRNRHSGCRIVCDQMTDRSLTRKLGFRRGRCPDCTHEAQHRLKSQRAPVDRPNRTVNRVNTYRNNRHHHTEKNELFNEL